LSQEYQNNFFFARIYYVLFKQFFNIFKNSELNLTPYYFQREYDKLNIMNQMEAILESISDGVFTVDKDWRVTSFNRAAERITGIPRAEALGKLCSEVFRSSLCEASCPLRTTLETGKPIINRPCFIVNNEEERIPISISTALLQDKAGTIIGGVETFRDLSELETLRKQLSGKYTLGDLVSHSPAMSRVFDLIQAVAPTDTTVLVQGETGTGKELVARAIHSISSRRSRPFITVNCGALPETLLESELFGYKRGAFTGAERDKPGRFALAKNGTVFLDEIGEISPALQVKLLRVLQEKTYEPLGGVAQEKTEARIIAATNRDLLKLVKENSFREDLYYRIHILGIDLPPLRKRKEDIPLLINHFLDRFNTLQGRSIKGLLPEAISLLMTHSWPGNVRELENIIERAFILCTGEWIGPGHLPGEITGIEPFITRGEDIGSLRKTLEVQAILQALQRNNGNRTKAAENLGIHKTTLYRKMKAFNIAF